MKSTKFLVGVFAMVVLVAGGLYGIQQINAGENCTAHTTATADAAGAKVETANATATNAGCCAAKAGTANAEHANATEAAGCCAAKAGTINAEHANATETAKTSACPSMAGTVTAEHAGAQCTYNAKTASAQCTSGAKTAELMSAEDTMAKLAHCGIDCRTVDATTLATKLTTSGCGAYTTEQWTSMIKSAQALDTKQSDVILANAKSGKDCAGEACPMKKVAADLAATQTEEKKDGSN